MSINRGVSGWPVTRATGHTDTGLLTRCDRPGELFANNAKQGVVAAGRSQLSADCELEL